MNIVKIQQDLIKDVLAGKSHNWFIQIKDSEAIIATKHQIFILHPDDCLLNANQLIGKGVTVLTTANKILDSADDAKLAFKTPVMRVIDGRTCIELKREDSDELVYVDQALLKYYDKSADFYVINHKSPVFIYESDILVGVVLPVKVG